MPQVTLYTIGHSNHTVAEFLELLRAHAVQVLVDVRSSPYSAYTPHFDRQALQPVLEEADIRYAWRGPDLGGRPGDGSLYDAAGRADYGAMAVAPAFLRALAWLEDGAGRARTAVMCSEEDPAGCHRRLLIARVLHDRGVAVVHILGDGSAVTEAAMREAENVEANGQQSLFDVREVTDWKSVRPIARKSPPRDTDR